MSPKAVRVRTASGWEDIALQGPPGPPGRSPSARAVSAISFAAADTYYRGIGLNFTNIVFDDFGNSFSPADRFTCRQTGRYLVIASFEQLTNGGAVGIAATGMKRISCTVTKGADGNTWGAESVNVMNMTSGDVITVAGYHSGGGTGLFTLEIIRLDGPGSGGLSAPFFPAIAGSIARLIPQQTIAFPANDGNGNSTGIVPLGFTWTQHLAFIPVYIWPLASWNWYAKNPYAGPAATNPLSNGQIMINNVTAQNFNVTAISIGIP